MAYAETTRAMLGEGQRDMDSLVSGLRKADPRAYAELCEQFGHEIQKFAVQRLLDDSASAEDIVIQTFVEASCNIEHFAPDRATFSAWLFGIARRKIVDELRRRGRRKSMPSSAQVPLDSVAEQAMPEDMAAVSVARLEARRQVARLKSCLSDVEMEVLALRCVHQMSLKDIASVVGRTERAIDSLLRRAKQKARERLGKSDD
jgi:RNA polymerase sigma-70 factor (ECF subfamily)